MSGLRGTRTAPVLPTSVAPIAVILSGAAGWPPRACSAAASGDSSTAKAWSAKVRAPSHSGAPGGSWLFPSLPSSPEPLPASTAASVGPAGSDAAWPHAVTMNARHLVAHAHVELTAAPDLTFSAVRFCSFDPTLTSHAPHAHDRSHRSRRCPSWHNLAQPGVVPSPSFGMQQWSCHRAFSAPRGASSAGRARYCASLSSPVCAHSPAAWLSGRC